MRKPVFALTPEYCMLNREAANANILLGDTNSRIGVLNDFVSNDSITTVRPRTYIYVLV